MSIINSMFDLSGKKALVIGASKGIGKEIALLYAHAGADIALAARNEELLEDLSQSINKMGRSCFPVYMDVKDLPSIDKGLEKIKEKFGSLDILVNSAAISPRRCSAQEVTREEWDEIIAVNLRGLIHATLGVGKIMIEQEKGGRIINLSSVAGKVALKTLSAYTTTKGGIEQFTKALALDWAEYNILVNGLAPGYFKTELTKKVWNNPSLYEVVVRDIPMNRFGRTEELLGTALLLASPAGSYITGQTIYVDGGYTAR